MGNALTFFNCQHTTFMRFRLVYPQKVIGFLGKTYMFLRKRVYVFRNKL